MSTKKKEEPQDPPAKPVLLVRVPFPMTPEERLITGDRVSAAIATRNSVKRKFEDEIASLTAKLKFAKESLKTEDQVHHCIVEDLRLQYDTRKEMRQVEAYIQFDLKKKTAQTIRADTQEVVHSRPMDDGEMQLAAQGQLFPVNSGKAEKEQRDDAKALAGEKAGKRAAPGGNAPALS